MEAICKISVFCLTKKVSRCYYGIILNLRVMLLHFYRKINEKNEDCFNVEITREMNSLELEKLKWLLSETFDKEGFSTKSFFNTENNIVEIGPRMNFETPFSTNAVSICDACGLKQVQRIEKSRRYLLPDNSNRDSFIKENHDRMTQCIYEKPLTSFTINITPEDVFDVPLLQEGIIALEKINKKMGLGMDEWDIKFYFNLFTKDIGRNPTNIECFQLGQANSEHSRHWFFKGKMIIDGQEKPEHLFDIVKSTWHANSENSVVAFNDNSSAIRGAKIKTILPTIPGMTSPFSLSENFYNILLTAETHNFPSGVAPFPGAETGTGGRIRDTHATGKGSLVVASTAGFCTGNLNIPNYEIPGEDDGKYEYPENLAKPLKILIEESNGGYDYGNKFGEPCIAGFTRTFGSTLPNKERREWIKPIMFTGGLGQIDEKHTNKEKPEKEMLVIQIGGPAYRIGMGGGSASSMVQGENKADLDFNAVQRGDAEMKQKVNRVIRTCVEMKENNPILSIHDQGAGGPCNIITELVEPVGGNIDIRKIKVGDKTMSVLEIWGAEYQERDGLLLDKSKLNLFTNICKREKVNLEVLGKIEESGRIFLYDSKTNKTLVDLELKKILGQMPQKTFEFKTKQKFFEPIKIPKDLTLEQIIEKVFKLPSVGSKGYLVRKVDRSVTGLIVQQQCCGPLQLPVSNVSAIAQSHFSLSGAATSIGEQPIKMLVDVKAGARMALGESLTNMVWAKISSIRNIKSSLNWMWPAKLENEGAELYQAAIAIRELMIQTGVAVDGGKDSLSMAAKVKDEIVKSPGQMVVSAYVDLPDIRKIITPDIKKPGESNLMFIDLADGKNRMGGSALGQAFKQIGNISPDVDDAKQLVNTFNAIQEMIENNLILSGHDRSDGGLITTLSEMAMSGNCGIDIKIFSKKDTVAQLFSEELGLVIEYMENNINEIENILRKYQVFGKILGKTTKEKKVIISKKDKRILEINTHTLLKWWEKTSDRLELEQTNKEQAKQQSKNHFRENGPHYHLTFKPEQTPNNVLEKKQKQKVAIIREEGSNGDREMSSAFFMAGFEVWDVNMKDLLEHRISLDQFNGIAFVGGFSYGDVLDSAKGWAGIIKFNENLKNQFDVFYNRPDTFSLGVCNGCQLMSLLGWIPFKDLDEKKQPRFIKNSSKRFESRFVNVKIQKSPAIMLKDMQDSCLGVWTAHGEGRFFSPDKNVTNQIKEQNLIPIKYINDDGKETEEYPFNPNGSPQGIASLCSKDGRHLAMMPHPERVFLKWQWPYMPEKWQKELKASPWLKMFQNAREWIEKNKV